MVACCFEAQQNKIPRITERIRLIKKVSYQLKSDLLIVIEFSTKTRVSTIGYFKFVCMAIFQKKITY